MDGNVVELRHIAGLRSAASGVAAERLATIDRILFMFSEIWELELFSAVPDCSIELEHQKTGLKLLMQIGAEVVTLREQFATVSD